MKRVLRFALIAPLALSLTTCSGQKNTGAENELAYQIEGAQIGAEATLDVAELIVDVNRLRPSALLGAYVAEFILHTSFLQSALNGVDAQMDILVGQRGDEDESFAILEDLGTILQADIVDVLNRSLHRSETFDDYVLSLDDARQRAQDRREILSQQNDELNTERREKRSVVADIQHNLNLALREEDYSTASSLQSQIVDAKAELARVESEQDTLQSIIRLYDNLLDIADERLTAMQANRDALIAGVKVIDLPGVKDLGILEKGRRGSFGSGFDRSLIDPNAN